MMNRRKSAEATGPPAVVVGLDCITGLQTARILARRGVRVIGVAEHAGHFACRTRCCAQQIVASTRSERLIEALERLARERLARGQLGRDDRPVLFPCTDTSVLLISRFRDRLQPHFRIALPDEDVVELLLDKVAFCEFANEHDLPIPGTFFLRSREDAVRAARAIAFPCILKPPMKTPRWERATKIKAFKLESAEALLATYDRCSSWADVLMVQEWVAGTDADLYSCNCYFDQQGRPRATFTARKLRQWPPQTGTSSLGEECRNEELREVTLRLFHSVGYRGLGYLEMKRDARTGRQWIIEPNIGRPTGRSAIAEAGGVELLYTMYCDLAGLPQPEGDGQRFGGVKWIYWRQDLRSAFHYWRRGELTVRDWLRSLAGKKACAVFSWSDPLPFVADWLGTVKKLGGRRAAAEPPAVRGERREAPRAPEADGVAGPDVVEREPVAAARVGAASDSDNSF